MDEELDQLLNSLKEPTMMLPFGKGGNSEFMLFTMHGTGLLWWQWIESPEVNQLTKDI